MPRPFFHKLILPNTLQDKKLRIPDNFVKKFRDELSVAVILAVRDGHVWRVGVRITDNKVWFQEGWHEFVERYYIRVGYYLVFRYEGNSCFSVSIFNLYDSEIDYWSNHGKQYPFEELEDECISPPAPQNLFAGSKLGTCVNWCGETGSRTSKGMDGQSFRDAQLEKSNEPGRKKQKFDHAEQDSSAGPGREDDADTQCRPYKSASARVRTVTSGERERAVNMSKLFEPTNPFCRVVLRPSYLYRGCIMYLPSCFAKKYLSGLSGSIKLQLPDGRQWPVQCIYRAGKAKLSRGWFEFASENDLGEGDVCIFELLQSREFVLKVTVFRVMENAGLTNRSW